ncbi:MAG: hypothetical protein KDE08_16590 [Rhodobacteraceae bacterium]|nr:hypothetical protein [Paracoccaceae bacterium]
MTRIAAVLTGDLIGSTKGDPARAERAMAALEGAAKALSGWRDETETRFTRFRGDGWQILVEPANWGLRAALFLKARLGAAGTGIDTRIAIGLGPVDEPGPATLAAARGVAFEASGRALDGMKKGAILVIDGAGVTGLHRAAVTLLAPLMQDWSREQAEAVAHAIEPAAPTLAQIAERLGITPQAVNYRLKAADYAAVDEALKLWESEAGAAGRGGQS